MQKRKTYWQATSKGRNVVNFYGESALQPDPYSYYCRLHSIMQGAITVIKLKYKGGIDQGRGPQRKKGGSRQTNKVPSFNSP